MVGSFFYLVFIIIFYLIVIKIMIAKIDLVGNVEMLTSKVNIGRLTQRII